MKVPIFLLLCIFIGFNTFAQESKADLLFFSYDYKQAINQYKKEMRTSPLNGTQRVNLADSYYKTDQYKEALDQYVAVNKQDSTMSDFHFNRMLSCMMKIGDDKRIPAFIATKTSFAKSEWLENLNFNTELLANNKKGTLDFEVFNVDNNSAQSDFSPSFFEDKLLFSSGRPQIKREKYAPSQEAYLDIFLAKVSASGNILGAQPYAKVPNSGFHKSTPYYSKELKSLFYVLSNAEEEGLLYDEKGKNSLSIGLVDFDGDFQYLLRDLSTSFYYPYYDAKNGNLYFAADFGIGYGGTDIYFVRTNNGRIMTAPQNLGPRVNSPGNEIAPFMFDGSLYFASDIFYGMGGMDIYKTNIQEDNAFSIPINLGNGINSKEDDFGFIIREFGEKGLLGYFASNREGGKGKDDIYGFTVKEKPGLKTLLVRGVVKNQKNDIGIEKAKVAILDTEGNLIKEAFSQENGSFQIEIPWRNAISININRDRYSEFTTSFNEESLSEGKSATISAPLFFLNDLVAKKEKQTVVKLKKFLFRRGTSTINPEIALELDKVVSTIKMFPQLQLRIESHTDSRGGGSSNHTLSQRRSNSIKKYLLSKGMASSNILYTVGYGEDKLVNGCANGVYCLDMLHKKNERSLIVILNYDLLY